MSTRDRILEAAMIVFRRHGFRRSSIEQTAEAAGLTRQALYHHFKSKEALFSAVIVRVNDGALAAGRAAADAAEEAGGSLADIIAALVGARLRQLIASFDGSPYIDELFSEHLVQARDLYYRYGALFAAQAAATIEDICRKKRLTLVADMTPSALTRCIELSINGAKSAYPSMQPADAFTREVDVIVRTLIAGAVIAAKPETGRTARTGDRK
jgi:AcrR family transcriptional regulator